MKCWLELVNFVVHVDMNYSSLLCICAICMVHSMPFTSNSYWFQIFFLYKRWQIHWPFIPEICYWIVLWELCFSQTNVLVVCTLLKLEQPLIILSVHTNIVIHKFLVSNASWQYEIHSFPQNKSENKQRSIEWNTLQFTCQNTYIWQPRAPYNDVAIPSPLPLFLQSIQGLSTTNNKKNCTMPTLLL